MRLENNVIIDIPSKPCSKCKQLKPETDFNLRSKLTGKLQASCRACTQFEGKRHYSNNKQAVKSKVRIRSKHYRNQCTEWKQQLHCSSCSENKYYCLDFHHLDPNIKDGSVGRLLATNSISLALKEIEKCIIVCSNCHRKIHYGDIEVTPELIAISKLIISKIPLKMSFNAPVTLLASNQVER